MTWMAVDLARLLADYVDGLDRETRQGKLNTLRTMPMAQWLIAHGVTVGAALPAEPEFKINHWANVQASGGLPAEHAPPDAKQKLTEILAQWQMADPSKLTADQWAILGGCAGYLMSHGVTVGARPALAGRGEQKISEPTEDELVSLGECAVRGYLDFPAAKSWFSNWLAGRAAQEGQKS